MARFNDNVLVAYFDREEATEEVRISGEFAALDGREKTSWREKKERLRRVRRVVHFVEKESIKELQDFEVSNPFKTVIEVDEVAEEDEIGKFYSHDNGADLVQEEGSTQPIRYPDQLISVVEDGSGAVSDRGNLSLEGSKGHKSAGTIAGDNIHAVILTNIAARIRKRQYNAAAETLDRAARLRAGIIDEDMEPNIGLRFADNTRLRQLYQEMARNAIEEMNRLQEPLSRDMLTEEYLREVMSAHSEESDKKDRQKSSLDLCKIGKRVCKMLFNYGGQATLVVSAVLGIFYFMSWFLRAFDALGVTHPTVDSHPSDFPDLDGSNYRKAAKEYFSKDRSYGDFQRLWDEVVHAGNLNS